MNRTLAPSAAVLLALAGPAAAADPVPGQETALGPFGYAVVVGSNRPGPGQEALSWAVDDARRVATVFTELGGLSPDRVQVLADPDPQAVLAALDAVQDAIEAHAEADERTGLLFYYSGHARARGLDLGGESLELDALRQRLDAMPATVRVVVLDACQSGAVSEVKGIAPAAAFSTASVSGLQAEGMAVIASSTATELSQESAELQGSFFTHHLVVGLRGAADRDLDGTVTLDEAYAYAYDRTVVATAATAVGRQHPTLETDLRGRGGVALTRPGVGSARLELTASQQGEILLVHEGTGTVAAEIDKAAGDRLVLALPAGGYTVLWRDEDGTRRCRQDIAWGRTQVLAPQACVEVVEELAQAKGETGPEQLEFLALEAGAGLMRTAADDAYVGRLSDFGYDRSGDFEVVGALQASASLHRHVALVLGYGNLESRSYSRTIDSTDGADATTRYRWGSQRVGLQARAQVPLAHDWLVPYAQAGGGIAWAETRFSEDTGDQVDEAHLGWHLSGGAGLQLMPALPGPTRFRQLGLYGQAEIVAAPVLKNLLDDTRDVGGLLLTAGLRIAL